MRIASYQMDIVPGQPVENRKLVAEWAKEICRNGKVDVLVLPEMWTTAYTLPTLEETVKEDKEQTEVFIAELAKEHQVNIVAGSYAAFDVDGIYNRSLIVNRAGERIHTYDKMHLVPMLDEPTYLKGGKHGGKMFELDGKKMGIIICYDLRFPELVRSLALQGAEMIFVVAEWPEARAMHWEILQQARAIENQVYIVSCNRVGTYDGVEFAGRSMVISPWGDTIYKASASKEETINVQVELNDVKKIREQVPVFKSRVPELYDRH
ncbi:carbon-nitrogen family hydrolase [Halalkalibacter krulwichiae]|uniref:2-oxoglutaramate amidase n=1 Tax=Halalkalibacter krulwichiae TaxID=199441 RepID=A0A1X9MBL8_9BACI|nr:carbon-nitrogen family hydrolase [Halalkalibacter krulwichiae]ARK28971.1 2-oxoglutaramate amidase [Halalkalibacter krulwichiae]